MTRNDCYARCPTPHKPGCLGNISLRGTPLQRALLLACDNSIFLQVICQVGDTTHELPRLVADSAQSATRCAIVNPPGNSILEMPESQSPAKTFVSPRMRTAAGNSTTSDKLSSGGCRMPSSIDSAW